MRVSIVGLALEASRGMATGASPTSSNIGHQNFGHKKIWIEIRVHTTPSIRHGRKGQPYRENANIIGPRGRATALQNPNITNEEF